MQTVRQTLVLCVTVLLGLAPLLRAGDEAPKPEAPKRGWQQVRPDRLIADSTFLYISVPDMAKTRAAYERSALRGLLTEEEIATPILSTFGKLRDAYVKGDGMLAEAEVRRRNDEVELLRSLIPYLDSQVVLAMDADFGAGARLPRFLLIASMPSEDRQREIEARMEKHRWGQTTDPRFVDINDKVGAYDVFRLENNELNVHEAWAFVENLFIYGQGKKIVEEAVERYAVKNSAGSLALHNGYQGAYREVGRDDRGGDALLYLQLDASSVLKRFAEVAPGAKDLLAAGLEESRPHLALGMLVSEGDNAAIKEKTLIRMGKGQTKGGEPCKAAGARFAQNDSLFFMGQNCKLAESYRNFMQGFALGARAAGGDAALDQTLKTWLGVQNDAELLAKLEMFKGEFAAFVSYVPQPMLRLDNPQDFLETFQFVIATELDRELNEVEFQNLMTKIEAGTKQSYVSAPCGPFTIRYQKGAAPREERDAKSGTSPLGLLSNVFGAVRDATYMPFFMCYARVDVDAEAGAPARKFLLVSDSMNALRKAITQSRAPRSSLSEDARFKELQRSFRDSRFEIYYVDLCRLVDIYAAALPTIGRGSAMARDTLNKLPSANALRSHLFPMGTARSMIADPEGCLLETYSPTGTLPLIGLAGLAAWPMAVDRERQHVSAQVDQKFKQVMLGLHLYAADFDRFPLQLSELYPNYVKNLSTFESPFKRNLLKSPQDIDNPELTNMIYIPGRSLQGLGTDLLLYEKEPTRLLPTRNEGSQLFHHVITLEGKKQWMPKSALDARLAGKIDIVTNVREKK